MAFSDKNFKSIGDVLLLYPVKHIIIEGLNEIIPIPASEHLAKSIRFALKYLNYKASEQAICESILHPILTEVWINYLPYFAFWSHKSLYYDDFLKGMPDFLFSKRSKLSHAIFERPYIAVVEAKLDDFTGGWAQCLLELIAMQKMNNDAEKPIYGIVTNGDFWEFGKLEGNLFTQYEEKISVNNLSHIIGILDYILKECKRIYIDVES